MGASIRYPTQLECCQEAATEMPNTEVNTEIIKTQANLVPLSVGQSGQLDKGPVEGGCPLE